MKYAVEPYAYQRGAQLVHKSATYVEEHENIRPLRDQLVVEPLERQFSPTILVVHEAKPVRGIVRAAGPGVYLNGYDHPEKHKRTKMWATVKFRQTQVKVGQIVQWEDNRDFLTFFWGSKLMLILREEDVVGVSETLDSGTAS